MGKRQRPFLPYSSFATPEANATLFSSLANRGGSVCLASNRRIDVPENVGVPASYAWATCSPPETVGKKRGAGRPIRPGTTALPKPCAEEDVSRPSLVSAVTARFRRRSAAPWPLTDPRKRSAPPGSPSCGCPRLEAAGGCKAKVAQQQPAGCITTHLPEANRGALCARRSSCPSTRTALRAARLRQRRRR